MAAAAATASLALVFGAAPAAAKVTPSLATNASTTTSVGLQVWDHTNLGGGASTTGSITFKLYGPGDTGCASPIFTSTVPVSGSGSDDSGRYTTQAAGTYNWVAAYSGDANNNPVATPCGAATQAVVVGKSAPAVSVTAGFTGGAVHGTGSLVGGFAPLSGTLTFYLTGPNNQFCSGAPIATKVVAVNGAGNYESGPFVPTVAGTYTYRVTYSGDNNNNGGVITGCLTQGAAVTVTQAQLQAPPTGSPPPPAGSPPPPSGGSTPPPSGSTPPPSGGSTPPGSGSTPPRSGGSTPPASGSTPSSGTSQTPTTGGSAPAAGAAGSPAVPGAQAALPAGPVLHGPSTCARGAFRVYVAGGSIRRVAYYLRGKRMHTVTHADARRRFGATMSTRGLHRPSRQRVVARVSLAHGTQVLQRAFTVCA